MENSLLQNKGVPYRMPSVFQRNYIQPFQEVKQFQRNVPQKQSPILNKQNVNRAVENTARRNVQQMNRVYSERKAKLDDQKFWEERNRKEYEQNQAIANKQKAEREQASDEYFSKLKNLYNETLKSDNPLVGNPITASNVVSGAFLLDTVSRFFGNAIDGNVEEKMAKVSMNEDKIRMAQNHTKLQEYDRMLSDINKQRQMYTQLLNDPKANKDVVKQTLQQLNQDSQDIFNKRKEAKQIDDAYKVNYVNDNRSFLGFIGDAMADALSTITLPGQKDSRSRARELAERRNQINLKQYDQIVKDNFGSDKLATKAYIDDLNTQNKEHLDDYNRDMRMKDFMQYNRLTPSKEYVKAEGAFQNASLFDPRYYLFTMPGMQGSSNSSLNQLTANAIRYGSQAAGLALSPVTGGASNIAAPIGTAVSSYWQVKGGLDENYVETGDKRLDTTMNIIQNKIKSGDRHYADVINDLKNQSIKYWKKEGRSNEWINQRYNSNSDESLRNILQDFYVGVTHNNSPQLYKTVMDASKGLQAQFYTDNMRTMAEMPVQLGVQFATPVKPLVSGTWSTIKDGVRAGQRAIYKNLLGRTVTDEAGNLAIKAAEQTAESAAAKAASSAEKYANGFAKSRSLKQAFKSGYEAGSSIGESAGFGYGGSVVGGSLLGTANAATYLAKKALPENLRHAIDDIGERAMYKFQKIYDKIAPKEWQKLALAYTGNSIARGAASAMSEGAEEGVQYLNSKEDFAKKYGWNAPSIGDIIANDFVQGSRVAKAYLSVLGLADSELKDDQEFWSNVKGGFSMGFMNPMGMVLPGNVRNAYRQYKANDFIKQSAVMDREFSNIERSNNADIVKHITSGGTGVFSSNKAQELVQALENAKKNDSRRESPMYTEEQYNEQIQHVNQLAATANNKNIRATLEAKGIKYGTDKYAHAVADLSNLYDQQKENAEQSESINRSINTEYNSSEFKKSVQDIADRYLSDVSNQMEISRKNVDAGHKAVKEEIENAKAAGIDTDTKEFKQHLDNVRQEAQDTNDKNSKEAVTEYVEQKTKAVNNLKAALTLKAQLNTIEDYFKFASEKLGLKTNRADAKLIRNHVDNFIKSAKDEVKKFNVDLGSTDKEALDALSQIDDVSTHASEGLQHSIIGSIMLGADKAVTDGYLRQFNYGIIRDKSGKSIYNPSAFKARQKRSNDLTKAILSGDKEAIEKYSNDINDEAIEQDNDAAVNDSYSKRIDAIMDTKYRQDTKNWLAEEVVEGDAPVRIYEQFENELSKQADEDAKQDHDNAIESTPNDIENQDTSDKGGVDLSSKLANNKRKYQLRKERAKRDFQRRKNRYDKFKKGNLNSTILPFQDRLVNIGNDLIRLSEQGAYKISQFVSDIKDIMGDKWSEDYMPLLRNIYVKQSSKMLFNGIDSSNLSSVDDVMKFEVSQAQENAKQNISQQQIYDIVQKKQSSVIPELSSYAGIVVKDNDGIQLYPNRYNGDKTVLDSYIDRLNQAIDNEGEFIKTCEELGLKDNVQLFSSYREYPGMIEHIAKTILSQNNNNQGVVYGKLFRSIVRSVMFGEDVNLGEYSNDKQIASIIQNLINFKNKLINSGFQILNLGDEVYGKLNNNENASSEVDVILKDLNGNITVIDVRTGYRKISDKFDQKIRNFSPKTYRSAQNEHLQDIQQILQNSYGMNVVRVTTLPIVADRGVFQLEGENGSVLLKDGDLALTKEQKETKLRENEQKAAQLVEQYNNLNKQLKTPSESLELQHLNDVQLSDNYIQQLQDAIDNVTQLLEQQESDNSVDEEHVESLDQAIIDNIDFNYLQEATESANVLQQIAESKCSELDRILSIVPSLKPSSTKDVDNINRLYQAIAEAQLAINDVIASDADSSIDITAEQQLVTSAIDFVVQNQDKFGKQALFVSKWWLTQFDNPSTNVNNSVPLMYYNQIKTWIDTLSEHALEDISNDKQLLAFYSSVFTNHFKKLLDNAQDQINSTDSEPIKILLSKTVQKGIQLYEDFYYKYSTEPDQKYDTEAITELDKIQRMPVRHVDRYGGSTYVSPSFKDMRDNGHYYSMSTQGDFLENYTTNEEVTDNKKHTIFNLYVKNGNVMLSVNYWSKSENKRRFCELSFNDNIEYFPNANQRDIEVLKGIMDGRQKFQKKYLAMADYVNRHPEKKIAFDVTTNKGSVIYAQPGTQINIKDSFIFNNEQNSHDLYTVKLSQENGIGVTTFVMNDKTGLVMYNISTGKDLNQILGRFDDKFTKQIAKTGSGMLVYYYKIGNDRISVTLNTQTIGDDRARNLVNLLQAYYNNQNNVDGFDTLSLIKQMLYVYDGSKRLSKYNNINNMVLLGDGGNIQIGQKEYNVFKDAPTIQSILSKQQIHFDAYLLNENLSSSDNILFKQIANSFVGDKQFITLPNGLSFSKDDITHNNQDGTVGSTYLGYLMRNGVVYTRAKSLGYRQLNISNLRIEDKGGVKTDSVEQKHNLAGTQYRRRERVVNTIEQIQKISQNRNGRLFEVSSIFNVIDSRNAVQQTAYMNGVQEYFNKVLGSNGSVEFTKEHEKYIQQITSSQAVIGMCTTQLIKLSRYAPMSTAYHEAFHKVLELCVDDKLRQSLYNSFRSYNGQSLTDRDVAEGLADQFAEYMSNWKSFKEGKGFAKVKALFKVIGFYTGVGLNYGFKTLRDTFVLYRDTNKGKYANANIDKSKIDRFNRLFGNSLYYKVKNNDTKKSTEFEYLNNSSDVNDMVRALAFNILENKNLDFGSKDRIVIDNNTLRQLPQSVINRLCGYDLEPGIEPDYINMAFREIFTAETHTREVKYVKDGITTIKNEKVVIYPKFAAIQNLVADYCNEIVGDVRSRFKENPEDNDDVDDIIQKSNIDKFDRASYEFDKLDSVSKSVKFVLSTLVYSNIVKGSDGKKHLTYDLSKNEFCEPTFIPLKEVYNTLVDDLGSVDNIYDLVKGVDDKALSDNTMYIQLGQKLHKIIDGMYQYDDKGDVSKVDYDKESFAIQLLQAVQSQQIDYIFAKSTTLSNSKQVDIKGSSMERDQMVIPRSWNTFLTNGQVGVFNRVKVNNKLQFNDGFGGSNGNDIFSKTANFIGELRQNSGLGDGKILIGDTYYMFNDPSDLNVIKSYFVKALNNIGIMFSQVDLDYMLSKEYGSIYNDALFQLLNKRGMNSIDSFIDMLNKAVNDSGYINQDHVTTMYTKNGFVSMLAKYKSMRNRNVVSKQALSFDGKKLFTISQNNAISHITESLNTNDQDNPAVKTTINFDYNVYNDGGVNRGSIILKKILNQKNLQLKLHTYIGFKTDNFSDQGNAYNDQTTVQDYMAKMTMLQQNYFVFPTLSDKSTYVVMSGLTLPGMQISNTHDQAGNKACNVSNYGSVMWINKKAYIRPSDDVLQQMLEYADTERLGIQQTMEQLGYNNIPGYQKQGLHILTDGEKIVNYHTQKGNVEPNGTRFLSLKSIYKQTENGVEMVYINDPNKSSVENLELANKEFFDLPLEEKKNRMALTLAMQTKHAIENAVRLGIAKRVDIVNAMNGEIKEKATNEDSILNLDSDILDENQINALQIILYNQNWPESQTSQVNPYVKAMRMQSSRSLAIAMLLSDITNKSIICSEECYRCYSGHPALFKVAYDFKNGRIKDSTFDLQKRLGGMVSTGDDNVNQLPGVGDEYTCAECKDYEVSSKADVINSLDDKFKNSLLRDLYSDYTGDYHAAYNKNSKYYVENPEDLIKRAEEYDKYKDGKDSEALLKLLNKALIDAKKFSDGLKDDINVADGASYITADMCKNLLRMQGKYTNKVAKAFDILTNDDTKYSWLDKADAYKLVYSAVNIVATKYTAYGIRDHNQQDGSQASNVAIHYYDKFALFPIFPCLATGRMNTIYNQMLKQGVDQMLMGSAVKVGSMGAIKFNGSTFEGKFNIYKQRYDHLRNQLNTDPEEGDIMAIGTQMVKIVLQNLRLNRKYNGVSGQALLDNLMSCINKISDIGKQKMIADFFIDGDVDKGVDNQKLSNYLKEQLGTRGVSKSVLQSVELDDNGKFNMPLSAVGNASWVESILISKINSDVIDINLPGTSFTQRSVFAIEDGSLQSDKNMSLSINNGKRLQMINSEGTMDSVISIDFFDSILPKGLSFNEARQWLIDNNIIGENSTSQTIGYRIPTQAQSSIHALKFVDIIPATKTAVILPEEFTKITGSDFDIDHLYLISKNSDFRHGEKTELNEEQQLQNEIVDIMQTLLRDTDNSIHFLYKSIDNDTELSKSVSDALPVPENTKYESYNFGTLHEQTNRKNDYITGKKGIGPFALNVTNHELTRLYGLKFQSDDITRALGIDRLDKLFDNNGNPIASWMSGFINAHVDIVKDPWISRLNVNPYTYNIVNYLSRMGVGQNALWLMCQPIIKDMAQVYSEINGNYLQYDNPSKELKDRYESIYAKYGFKQKDLQAIDNKQLINIYRQLIQDDNNDETLKKNALLGNPMDARAQLDVLALFNLLNRYATQLANLVSLTKIDTRKHGKTILQQQIYLRKYNKLKTSNVFESESLDNFLKNSWIDTKTTSAITLSSQILGKVSYNANKQFQNLVLGLASNIYGDFFNEKQLNAISNHIQTYINQKYIVGYIKGPMGKGDDYIHNLFFGSYSIPARLNMLNYHIQNNPDYQYLKNNFLLQQLYFDEMPKDVYANGEKIEQPVFLKLSDRLDGGRTSTDMVADAWLDMLNDKDENVRNFAKDLVMYAYLTSGSFSGWNKLAKYIPYEFISGQVDSDFNIGEYVRNVLDNNDFDYDLKSVVLNMGVESGAIKKVSSKNSEFFDKKAKNVLIVKTESPRRVVIRNVDGVDRYFYFVNYFQYGREAIYFMVSPKGFHSRQGDIYEHYFDLGYKANDVKINKISQLNALINLGLDAKTTAYDGKIEVGDIVMDSKTFIAEEYDYMNGPIQVREKDNIKQFKNTAQVYTYYKLLAYGYLDYAKDVLDNPDKTVTYQMWLESPQVQSVLTEKQVQMWNSIKDDVQNHIIRYDSRGVEENAQATPNQTLNNHSYGESIQPNDGYVFVFGSNPEGRHGAGAAKVAVTQFGAKYGIGEGLIGDSYALPTKDLRVKENKGLRSISKEEIINNISNLYKTAKYNPNKKFAIAYTNVEESSLNGYTGIEMADMFKEAGLIPNNIYFSNAWIYNGLIKNSDYEPNYYVNHSGGAVGSDSYWGAIGEKYGVVSEHYYYGNKTPNGNHQITQEQFEEGKEHVLKANETLHRRPDNYMNLLSRNYAQVKNADAIFAVGQLNNGIVDGGTGWAVQMAIDDGKPVYIYDQVRKQWFANIGGKWQVYNGVPKLTKNFAGIGTRQLNQDGKDAIKQVYENTFNNDEVFDDSKFDQSNMDHCKKQ